MLARRQYEAKTLSKAELVAVEDECISEAIAMQERAGVDVITDGEYRKRGWREFFYDKVEGFGPDMVDRDFPIRLSDGTFAPLIKEPKVTAKLKRREPLTADDFARVRAMTAKSIKATLPTPSI
jgi:5-methyltetrahydropteroyltriglutamate--homocysteine methyltransferase